MPTVFAKIARGELSADIVYKDDLVTAFRDIAPLTPVHVLIVPNKVIPTVNDLDVKDKELVGHMMIVAKQIAKQEGISSDGYRIIINCNQDAGQEVFHLHMHLLGGRPLGPMVQRQA
jgi:histidine triad (HIT) family protein